MHFGERYSSSYAYDNFLLHRTIFLELQVVCQRHEHYGPSPHLSAFVLRSEEAVVLHLPYCTTAWMAIISRLATIITVLKSQSSAEKPQISDLAPPDNGSHPLELVARTESGSGVQGKCGQSSQNQKARQMTQQKATMVSSHDAKAGAVSILLQAARSCFAKIGQDSPKIEACLTSFAAMH